MHWTFTLKFWYETSMHWTFTLKFWCETSMHWTFHFEVLLWKFNALNFSHWSFARIVPLKTLRNLQSQPLTLYSQHSKLSDLQTKKALQTLNLQARQEQIRGNCFVAVLALHKRALQWNTKPLVFFFLTNLIVWQLWNWRLLTASLRTSLSAWYGAIWWQSSKPSKSIGKRSPGLWKACGKAIGRTDIYNIDRVEPAHIFESLRNSFCQCEGFESLRGTFWELGELQWEF